MKSEEKLTIAVDGFSSCGKSTLAKALAKELGYSYIDTGAMYRTVTLFALKHGLIVGGKVKSRELISRLPEIRIDFRYNSLCQGNETRLNGENVEDSIRSMEVSNHVSAVSTIKEVRTAMVEQQRQLGKRGGVVMDGRDIGTVVLPDADLKIFMTASPDIRAQRRFDELQAENPALTLREVKANIQKRDYIDQNRVESPLRKADDAMVLDNSHLSREQQLQWALKQVEIILQEEEAE